MTEESSTCVERQASQSSANTEASSPKRPYEGGAKAWLTVMGSVLVYISSFGILNSFGFFQHYYRHNFLQNTAPSTIAFIGTLQLALMYCLASISGALCDSYGIKHLYIVSGLGTSGALLALSFILPGRIWQVLICQGLLMGSTIAFGVQPALTVVGQHFDKKRALAMGVVSAGAAIGGMLFPILFAKLLPVVGFPWSLRIAGFIVITSYFIALSISTSKSTGKPIKHLSSLLDFKGFNEPEYYVLSIGAWLAQLGLWVPGYYVQSFCAAVYPRSAVKDYLLPLMNGGSIVGMVVGGVIADKIGRLNLLWLMTMISGLACLLVWLLTTSAYGLIVFSILYGLSSGSFTSLLPPTVGQLTPHGKLGARMGAFYSVVAIAGLIGTPIAGSLLRGETKQGYSQLILFTGSTLTMGAIVMLASRLIHNNDLRKVW